MKPFQRILFPVDFSPKAIAMAPVVVHLAGKFDAEVKVLHALGLPPAGYGEWYVYTSDKDVEAMLASARTGLERFVSQHLPGVKATTLIDPGGAANAIVDTVTQLKIDLVMMPTQGYGKFRTLLLGSVTSAVLHDVSCPVWTDAHAAAPTDAETPAVQPGVVVCAVDLSPSTIHVLRTAKEVAQKLGAKLRVVHSEPAIEDPVRSDSAARFRRFLIHNAKEDYAPLAALANVTADLEILEGPVGTGIARAAASHRAELLVIGRGAIQGTLGRLRTHTIDIIRRSPCPVLSV